MTEFDHSKLFYNCLKGILLSALVWGFAVYNGNRLSASIVTSPELAQEPIQSPTHEKSFEVEKQGQSYQINPIFDYELWGLVVADHDSNGWDDYDHAQWKDFLNTKDICVIWGKNLESPKLNKLSFSHGQFTCYVNTSNSEAWRSFDVFALSNNHVIPANLEISEAIMRARIGDEIHVKGQLVNYGINHGPPRTTSTTRKDTGPGACEIVYVNQFDILGQHNLIWSQLRNFALLVGVLFGIGIASALILPFFRR